MIKLLLHSWLFSSHSGWSLTTTVGLKSDVAVLKEKVSGIENEVQDIKAFSKKKKRKKKNSNN